MCYRCARGHAKKCMPLPVKRTFLFAKKVSKVYIFETATRGVITTLPRHPPLVSSVDRGVLRGSCPWVISLGLVSSMGDFLGSGCPPWVMALAISFGLADFRGS